MQHFGSRFQAEVQEQWRQHYVPYTELKQLIRRVEAQRIALVEQQHQRDEQNAAAASSAEFRAASSSTGGKPGSRTASPTKPLSGSINNSARQPAPQATNEDLCGELFRGIEAAIVKADAFASSIMVSDIGAKFQAIMEANGDLLDDGLFGSMAAGGGGGGGGATMSGTFLSRSNTASRPSGVAGMLAASASGGIPPPLRADEETGAFVSADASNVMRLRKRRSGGLATSTPAVRVTAGFAFPSSPSVETPHSAGVRTPTDASKPKATPTSAPSLPGSVAAAAAAAEDSTGVPASLRKFMRPAAPVAAAAAATATPTTTAAGAQAQQQLLGSTTGRSGSRVVVVSAPESELGTVHGASAGPAAAFDLGADNLSNVSSSPVDTPNKASVPLLRSDQKEPKQQQVTSPPTGADRPPFAASVAESIFDAVMGPRRASTKSGVKPEDVQLALLVEMHGQLVQLFRFVEVNQLCIRRLVSKYDKYCIAAFGDTVVVGPTTASSSAKTSPTGKPDAAAAQRFSPPSVGGALGYGAVDESAAAAAAAKEQQRLQSDRVSANTLLAHDFQKTSAKLHNLCDTSPLRDRLIQCERMISRVRSTAEALFGKEEANKWFPQSIDSLGDQKHWAAIKFRFVLLAAAALFLLLALPIFEDNKAAHACAAMTVCIAVLWATEAVPFFATAMFIPLLAVPLGVLASTPPPAGATEFTHADAAKMLLGKMFGGTQILVLGGLVMGRALQKHKLELIVSRYLLAPLAHRPRIFVLALMIISVLACAVLTNVAAPVLLLNVVQPTLWRMERSSGAPQMILLATAFAGNFGGMFTSIASPQNAVALQSLASAGTSIGFVDWMYASAPIVFCGILAAWAILLAVWNPFPENYVIPVAVGENAQDSGGGFFSSGGGARNGTAGDGEEMDELAAALLKRHHSGARAAGATMSESVEKALVLATCVITIALWCVPSKYTFGDPGVVALLPIVVFFGVGVLSKEDFNNLSWHLLFLLAGGNMLGVCTKESGLLQDTIQSMKPFLTGSSEFAVVAVLILAVALITTFISHTVAALILMPVIVEIAGVNPSLPSAQALVFLTVIMCSGSMAFPISSFPNVNSLLAEDEHGHPYLEPKHYLLPGAALSLLSVVALISFMLPFAEFLFPK